MVLQASHNERSQACNDYRNHTNTEYIQTYKIQFHLYRIYEHNDTLEKEKRQENDVRTRLLKA